MNKLAEPIILLIDTNAISLTATSAALNGQNYQVICADSAEAAFEVCNTVSLDLIICDVALQRENDGYDLIQQIKQNPAASDVPVVFMSAGQAPDVISRSTTAGTAYHLKKPFEPNALLELIEKALWLPHLVKTHINKPHIPFGSSSKPSAATPHLYQ